MMAARTLTIVFIFLAMVTSGKVFAVELNQVPIDEVQESMTKFQQLLQEFASCYNTSCSFDKKQELYLRAKLEGQKLKALTTRVLQILLAEGQSIIDKSAKRGLEDQACKDLRQRLAHLKEIYSATSDSMRKQLILAQGDILFQKYRELCQPKHLEQKLRVITTQIRILTKLKDDIDNLLFKLDETYSSRLQDLAKFDKELKETLQKLSEISGLKSFEKSDNDHPWLQQNF